MASPAPLTYRGFSIDHPDARARDAGKRSEASMRIIVGKQDKYRMIPMSEEELIEVATEALNTAETLRGIRKREEAARA